MRQDLEERWLALTRDALPQRARREHWPLRLDHCFQRILLDAVFGGCWYDHVAGRPAYRHLGADELGRAVSLAERLAAEDDARLLVEEWNARSLRWRGKAR